VRAKSVGDMMPTSTCRDMIRSIAITSLHINEDDR